MKSRLTCLFVGLAFCSAWSSANSKVDTPPDRQIAITIDDLPAAAANSMSAAAIAEMTVKLLATLRQRQVPTVGFVNEGRLYKWGEVDARIKALNMWLDAGFELGNHTYGHTSLNTAGLKEFEESVVRGETVTRLLLADHKQNFATFAIPIWMSAGICKPGAMLKPSSWRAAIASLPSPWTPGIGPSRVCTTTPKNVAIPHCNRNSSALIFPIQPPSLIMRRSSPAT